MLSSFHFLHDIPFRFLHFYKHFWPFDVRFCYGFGNYRVGSGPGKNLVSFPIVPFTTVTGIFGVAVVVDVGWDVRVVVLYVPGVGDIIGWATGNATGPDTVVVVGLLVVVELGETGLTAMGAIDTVWFDVVFVAACDSSTICSWLWALIYSVGATRMPMMKTNQTSLLISLEYNELLLSLKYSLFKRIF